jgi:hypothetical protein
MMDKVLLRGVKGANVNTGFFLTGVIRVSVSSATEK